MTWGSELSFLWENHGNVTGFQPVVKNLFVNAGDIRDVGSVPGLGRSSGGRHGSLLQYSCLENPVDRGAWQAMVHRITRS